MFAYQALFANFPKDVQAGNAEVLALYRQETAIQQRVEKEYQAFDLLIEQSPQDFQDDALRKCLEDYKPQGRPN